MTKRRMTKREQARYRAIMRHLFRLRERGWTPDTHPDLEPLQRELDALADRMTAA